MKLNKILALLLALVMVFSLAACGNDAPADDPDVPDAPVAGDEEPAARV
ncbi:MAG: BMP family ABC transporter substrate-binding protein, partial [Ruminococcaceae bacterium]|nr:BMP family ABC transporter substrate-binding protein [Oscillospiraceae bacterium]